MSRADNGISEREGAKIDGDRDKCGVKSDTMGGGIAGGISGIATEDQIQNIELSVKIGIRNGSNHSDAFGRQVHANGVCSLRLFTGASLSSRTSC